MLCRPAMKITMLKPKFFHTASRMMAGMAQRGSPSQSIGWMPESHEAETVGARHRVDVEVREAQEQRGRHRHEEEHADRQQRRPDEPPGWVDAPAPHSPPRRPHEPAPLLQHIIHVTIEASQRL